MEYQITFWNRIINPFPKKTKIYIVRRIRHCEVIWQQIKRLRLIQREAFQIWLNNLTLGNQFLVFHKYFLSRSIFNSAQDHQSIILFRCDIIDMIFLEELFALFPMTFLLLSEVKDFDIPYKIIGEPAIFNDDGPYGLCICAHLDNKKNLHVLDKTLNSLYNRNEY